MKYYLLTISLVFGILLSAFEVLAQQDLLSNLTYPIKELGDCQSRQDCEAYCDKTENIAACLNFAETHNLLSNEDIAMGRRMLTAGEKGGPGSCKGKEACETYCDNIEHLEECLAFAQKHNLIPADELAEAQKVLQAFKKGIKPPACKRKSECDIYCQEPEHMEECLIFGEAAGLIPTDELQEAKRVLESIKKGVKPPACRGKKECDAFCARPENMEACFEFGIAAGFIPPNELDNAKKTLQAIKKGVRPPNCQGKEECDIYCQEPSHMAECINFGIAAGFMPAEEVENAKKTLKALEKGVRPPNCQGKEACDAYCKEEAHFEECMNFAEAAGFMSAKDAERARRTGGKGPGGCTDEASCQAYCQDPTHTKECLDFAVKAGDMSSEEAAEILKRMQAPPPPPPEGTMGPPAEQPSEQPAEQPAEGIEGSTQPEFQPTPESQPQSFLKRMKNFLGNIANILGF